MPRNPRVWTLAWLIRVRKLLSGRLSWMRHGVAMKLAEPSWISMVFAMSCSIIAAAVLQFMSKGRALDSNSVTWVLAALGAVLSLCVAFTIFIAGVARQTDPTRLRVLLRTSWIHVILVLVLTWILIVVVLGRRCAPATACVGCLVTTVAICVSLVRTIGVLVSSSAYDRQYLALVRARFSMALDQRLTELLPDRKLSSWLVDLSAEGIEYDPLPPEDLDGFEVIRAAKPGRISQVPLAKLRNCLLAVLQTGQPGSAIGGSVAPSQSSLLRLDRETLMPSSLGQHELPPIRRNVARVLILPGRYVEFHQPLLVVDRRAMQGTPAGEREKSALRDCFEYGTSNSALTDDVRHEIELLRDRFVLAVANGQTAELHACSRIVTGLVESFLDVLENRQLQMSDLHRQLPFSISYDGWGEINQLVEVVKDVVREGMKVDDDSSFDAVQNLPFVLATATRKRQEPFMFQAFVELLGQQYLMSRNGRCIEYRVWALRRQMLEHLWDLGYGVPTDVDTEVEWLPAYSRAWDDMTTLLRQFAFLAYCEATSGHPEDVVQVFQAIRNAWFKPGMTVEQNFALTGVPTPQSRRQAKDYLYRYAYKAENQIEFGVAGFAANANMGAPSSARSPVSLRALPVYEGGLPDLVRLYLDVDRATEPVDIWGWKWWILNADQRGHFCQIGRILAEAFLVIAQQRHLAGDPSVLTDDDLGGFASEYGNRFAALMGEHGELGAVLEQAEQHPEAWDWLCTQDDLRNLTDNLSRVIARIAVWRTAMNTNV